MELVMVDKLNVILYNVFNMSEGLSSRRQGDFDEQAKAMSPEQIFDQLGRDNMELAQLGVKSSISVMTWGASRYGHDYENRSNKSGGVRPTPMNCLMALLHSQEDLRQLSRDDFGRLGKVVSRIAVATEALLEKKGKFEWPDQFTKSPQGVLPPKPTA